MTIVRLVREVKAATGTGPGNGQYALQKALRARAPCWLRIGGMLTADEIPWFWCWLDRDAAAMCATVGRPFIVGPNMLFENSRQPCRVAAEREICNAAACRLMFTESAWYGRLIESYRGPLNHAPIVLWPYPIDPFPPGPLPPRYNLLIYDKRGADDHVVNWLCRRWPNSRVVRYGRYQRSALIEIARRSRCCTYLSDDDRGPLALAEIMLCGCPTVGVPRGAPWIEAGITGFDANRLDPLGLWQSIERALTLDRCSVRAAAQQRFDAGRIVETILEALESLAIVPAGH